MKYVGVYEYDIKDVDKVFTKAKEIWAEREQFPDKYPKRLLLQDGSNADFGILGEPKGFALYETDDPAQIMNLILFWAPVKKYKFMPIVYPSEKMAVWEKSKQ